MELDSVSQTARLTQERAQSVLNCLNTFKNRTAAPLKQFQRLLGHMAAAAVVTPLGLLHMRPLQHWLHGRVPRWAWQSGTLRVQVTPACRQTFTPWSDLSFLRAGVPLEQVSRHAVVYTDASAKGWGATFNGHAVLGVWTGPQLHWHINCLELLAVHLALNRLKRRLRGEHVLVRTDNSATVAYINRQGGLRSRRMSQLARHLLLWSRKHLRSLRAIHIPGLLNRTADELSRAALPGEWRLHPQTVQLIWRRFGLAQVDLFASLETSHCQLFYSLTDGTLGTDALAHSWAGPSQICISPSEPSRTDTVQGQEEEEQILLAYQDLVPRADAPRDSPSLADSSEEGSTDSETGHLMAPASRPLETSCLVPRRDAEVLSDLPQEVVDTITWREHRLRDTLTPWSGTCSSNGALLTQKTPGDARSESCYPSCSKGWSEGCLPPPSRSTWPRLLPTTTLWKGSRWGSMTGSSGSLGGLEGWILHAPPLYPLGTCP